MPFMCFGKGFVIPLRRNKALHIKKAPHGQLPTYYYAKDDKSTPHIAHAICGVKAQ